MEKLCRRLLDRHDSEWGHWTKGKFKQCMKSHPLTMAQFINLLKREVERAKP